MKDSVRPRLLAAFALAAGLASLSSVAPSSLEAQSTELRVQAALAAAPAERKDGATVIGMVEGQGVVVLREGNNDLICLAPEPGAERFNAACYHESLEPYMARGRALVAEGITDSAKRYEIRWAEADAGTLPMPDKAATSYLLQGPIEAWNTTTGEIGPEALLRWVVYVPWATAASTGLSEEAVTGGPWLMFPGTAGAHIMITPPRP